MNDLGVIARRQGEPLDEAARRVAIDALYTARDSGGTMHDAGAAAGDAVSSLYAGAVEALRPFAVPDSEFMGEDGIQVCVGITRAEAAAIRAIVGGQ